MLVCLLLQPGLSQPLLGAAENLALQSVVTDSSDWGWNLVISLTVLLVTLASAALPVAALRQWQGVWRVSAALPLLILAIWLGIIFISRVISAESHGLWALEVFGWAMLNMIYMVALMTTKRIFEKADKEKSIAD